MAAKPCYDILMRPTMRTLLVFCYVWLLLSAGWQVQPLPSGFGGQHAQSWRADGLAAGSLLRLPKIDIEARAAARPVKPGDSAGADSPAAIPGAQTPIALAAPAACAFACRPAEGHIGFLAQRTRDPRAPPA